MSTTAAISAHMGCPKQPSGACADASAEGAPPRARGLGLGLSALLLIAAISTLVLLATRWIDTWADEHLFLAWVALWVVVFACFALFADTARALVLRAQSGLDAWSRSMARRRAEARMWVIAQSDPRLMADLGLARNTEPEAADDFSQALAPLGVDTGMVSLASTWERYVDRLVAQRGRSVLLHYI